MMTTMHYTDNKKITHTLKATSKYSLTEAHRSSIFLDVPFWSPFSTSAAFLIDIAETNSEDVLLSMFFSRRAAVTISQTHHIVHLKRAQTSSDAGGGWGWRSMSMKKHKTCIYPKRVLFILTRKDVKHMSVIAQLRA